MVQLPTKEKRLPFALLWMLISQLFICCYILFAPIPVEVNIHKFILGPILFHKFYPLSLGALYVLPIIIFISVIIFVVGNSSICAWFLGIVPLYIMMVILVDFYHIRWNAFGVEYDILGAAGIVTIPFWCIFFFLWELLFCVIAKRWRRKLDAEDRGME